MRSNTLTRVSNNPGAVHINHPADEFYQFPAQFLDLGQNPLSGHLGNHRPLTFQIIYERPCCGPLPKQ